MGFKGARFVLDKLGIGTITRNEQLALEQAAAAVKTKIIADQVMPFDQGALQNESTFVDTTRSKQGKVRIVTAMPYARRLYFHPEYNFQTVNNPYAGGRWFDYLISGAQKDFARRAYAARLKRLNERGGGT